MKKLLIVLLALTVMGMFAVAQDAPAITWNVSSYNGFATVSDSNADTSSVALYNYNWEGAGAYRFQMAVNAADGNSGFQMRLQTADQTAATPAFNQIWAYGKFLDGMVKVEGGLLNDYSIATGGWECYGNTDGALGLQVDVAPIDGLALGFFLPLKGIATNANYNAIGNAQIGAAYEMKDMFKLAGGYILSPTTNGSTFYAGLVLKAVPGLSANVEFKFANLGDSKLGTTNIEEYASYSFGAVTVSAYAGEWMYASASSKLYYNFEPQVAYKVSDAASVALVANVYTFNDAGVMSFVSPVDGIGALQNKTIGGDPTMAFGAGPNVQLKAGGAKVTIGDYYGILPSVGALKATNINVFYASFDYAL